MCLNFVVSAKNLTFYSFLSNTGEAAATFTFVALAGLALLVAAVVLFIRRRRRNQSQDDDEFFEKILEPQVYDKPYDRDSIAGSRGLASLDPVRTTRNKSHANDMYNTHGGDYGYTAQSYGLSYPPGASYTPQEPQNAYTTPWTPNSHFASPTSADPFSSQVPGRSPLIHVANANGNPFESDDPFHAM